MIDSAELISGDVNIQSTSSDSGGSPLYSVFGNGDGDIDIQQQGTTPGSSFNGFAPPTISDAEELIGVYIYTINETFILDPRSNYILPIFRPMIDIERYGSIEKYFSSMDNRGNAERAYRLRVEDIFLPQGKVFVRESDRLVGEIYSPDLAANETNEFNLGRDPDLQYIEYVQFKSRREAYETITNSLVLLTYTIDLHLINIKQRSISVEYRLRFASQDNLTLKENTKNNLLQVDGSSLIGIFELNANDEQQFKFTFETR
jgi:hypothetical protein